MKSKKVLIVDDNDLNRKLFENLIGQISSFESAHNGLEAVAMTELTAFDLILMDIQMPRMDGITAMKKIRQGSSKCPILAVTAYAEESERSNFLEHGFDDFITKPIRPKEFIQLIQAYLKGEKKDKYLGHEAKAETEILSLSILSQLLKYNSKSVIKKILEDFLIECEETEELINRSLEDSEYNELIEKIHVIKGNSGTLGAMGIFMTAMEAEELRRKECYIEFQKSLTNLKNEISQFREFLKQETIFEP